MLEQEILRTWKIFWGRSFGLGSNRVAGAAVSHTAGHEQHEFVLRSAQEIPQDECSRVGRYARLRPNGFRTPSEFYEEIVDG